MEKKKKEIRWLDMSRRLKAMGGSAADAAPW